MFWVASHSSRLCQISTGIPPCSYLFVSYRNNSNNDNDDNIINLSVFFQFLSIFNHLIFQFSVFNIFQLFSLQYFSVFQSTIQFFQILLCFTLLLSIILFLFSLCQFLPIFISQSMFSLLPVAVISVPEGPDGTSTNLQFPRPSLAKPPYHQWSKGILQCLAAKSGP